MQILGLTCGLIIILLPAPIEEVEKFQMSASSASQPVSVLENFILGADVSSLPQVWDAGASFALNGSQVPPLMALRQIGFQYARVRLWVDPSVVPEATDSYCDLNHTIELAKVILAANWSYLLDFHYSDWWADPSQQNTPYAWQSLNFEGLNSALYNYTYETLATLASNGVLPQMVQVGNEISHGFLWPQGGTENWTQFTTLLKSAIDAIHQFEADYQPEQEISIMLHYAPSDDMGGAQWFFEQLAQYNVSYDVMGISYYPKWHGSLENLNTTLTELATEFQQPIVIVETAFPFTTSWNDAHSNIFYQDIGPVNYSISPTGQRAFLSTLIHLIADLPLNAVKGVFYWEPAWVTPCIGGSPMENAALFDFDNELLAVYASPLITSAATSDDSSTSSDDDTISDDSGPSDQSQMISGYPSTLLIGICGAILCINSQRTRKMHI